MGVRKGTDSLARYPQAMARRAVVARAIAHKGAMARARMIDTAAHHPLIRQFFELVRDHQHTIMGVARRAGVDRRSITLWRWIRFPRMGAFIACLNAIGYDLAIVPLKKPR